MKAQVLSYNVSTTPEKYFHQLVELLRILPPFKDLRKRERETFAEILYQFYVYRNESEEVCERIVFDYKTKEEIAKRLKISKGNLYNIYKELRQHDLLTKDGINGKYLFKYLQFGGISFKFERERNTEKEVHGNGESDSKPSNQSS